MGPRSLRLSWPRATVRRSRDVQAAVGGATFVIEAANALDRMFRPLFESEMLGPSVAVGLAPRTLYKLRVRVRYVTIRGTHFEL